MTRRVVIAEDEAIIRLDLKEILQDEGYDVVGETGRGDEVVDLVRRHRPDVAILDIKMPGSDGLAAARAIADLGERVAVLILTAFSQRDLIEEAREAGVAAYLVKPFQRAELVPAIDQAVSRCEQEWAIDAEAAEVRANNGGDAQAAAEDKLETPPTGRRGQGPAHGTLWVVRVGCLQLHPKDGHGQPLSHERRGPPGARRHHHALGVDAAIMARAATTTEPTPEAAAAGGPATDKPAGPLLLLDGMSLAFRAYFALPPDLATSAGIVTNAVHGFTSMLHNLVRDHHPSGLAVAFDLPGETFRDEVVEDYKAGRSATPADLLPQFEMIRSLLGKLAIPVIEVEGFEADDVLATLATEARDRGHDVLLVTGDRDAYQLVEDPHVRVLYNRRGVSDYALYDEAGIEERTGVRPELYPVLAALRGDPSDNLPGVPGVGEKTAAKLVNEYGDLDTLYAHLDALSPKLRQNLAEHEERVRRNAEVIPLVRDVPLDTHVDQLTLGGWNEDEAREAFAELELRTIWNRIVALIREGAFGQPGGDAPRIPIASPGSASKAGASRPSNATGSATTAWLDNLQVETPGTADEAVGAIGQLVTRSARRERQHRRARRLVRRPRPFAAGRVGPDGRAV